MEENLTPAMKQYYDLKKEVLDGILFFRMGDFYEMFGDDAQIAHRVLGVALTTRNKNAKDPIALAGIPYHAKEKYLPKLVEAGYKVAIAEQVSDPKLKWIVKREIVRIVTPWTLHIEMDSQNSVNSHFIISLVTSQERKYGMSILNMTTHEWICSQFDSFEFLAAQLYKYFPDEVILSKELFDDEWLKDLLHKKFGLNIYLHTSKDDYKKHLLEHFWVKNLEGYGIEDKALAQMASSLLLHYVSEVQKNNLNFLDSLRFESFSEFLEMDASTMKSLDILFNFFTKSAVQWTLFWVLSYTKTSMWSRYLKQAIARPLQDIEQIEKRQRFIQALVWNKPLLDSIQEHLKNISDIDTILYRVALKKSLPRDIVCLRDSLKAVLKIKEILKKSWEKDIQAVFL